MHADRPSAEQLFERFRRTGEPEPLGHVFDLVADELFGVALHLADDTAQAEDLVQATFVAAIQRARRWDGVRPLRPWLLGMLWREAKHQRRRARIRPCGDVRPVRTPLELAEQAEVEDVVREAVAGLAEPYRAVVELRLLRGLPIGEIAARLRRSPGSVRTQLWRGLERLRARLPRGVRAAPAACLLPHELRTRLRARVVGAAKGGAPASAGVVTSVLLMNKKIVVVAVALAAAVPLVTWLAPSAAETPPAPAAAGAPAASAADAPRAATGDQREAVAADPPPAAPTEGGSPAAPRRYLVRLQAVDAAGVPVPHAAVMAGAAADASKPSAPAPEAHAEAELRELATTDVHGRCSLWLAEPQRLIVTKRGVGRSADLHVRAGKRELDEELYVVVGEGVRVRGIVLDRDGRPAPRARVSVRATGIGTDVERAWVPDDVPTDDDGRFALRLGRAGYGLRARVGEDWTSSVGVDLLRHGADPVSADDRHVELRVSGRWSVRGSLVDADGRPAAGEVDVLRLEEREGEARVVSSSRVEAGTDGAFEQDVSQTGRYLVLAAAAGGACAERWIDVTDGAPHVDVVLRLRRPSTISGRLVGEDGRPRAGVVVTLDAQAAADGPLQRSLARYQRFTGSGPTAADGSFSFTTTPGQRYRLACLPGGKARFKVYGPEVSAPADGVVFVVSDLDRRGFVLEGRVVDAVSRAPVEKLELLVVEPRASGSYGEVGAPAARDGEGGFHVGPLSCGTRYCLAISAEGYGRVDVGPFEATPGTEEIVVELPKPGALACRVVRANGAPQTHVEIALERVPHVPFERYRSAVTGADGTARLDGLDPGRYLVWAVPRAPALPGAKIEVDVRPEAVTTLEVRLPE